MKSVGKIHILIFLVIFFSCQRKNDPQVLPTRAQIEWADAEVGTMFHLDVQVFEPDYKWRETRDYQPDPAVFNPKYLDTDQWIATSKAMGATYAVLVAKHCSGFSLWPTEAHDYSVKNSPWKNGQGDIVKDFIASCKKYGLKPGLYASASANAYYHVDNPGLVLSEDPEEQKEYNEMVKTQMTELWSNYGELFEIWFDGGVLPPEKGGIDMASLLLKYQPNAITFQGPFDYPNNIRWVGNEDGVAPYPCWSRADSTTTATGMIKIKGLNGNPEGAYWCPGEADFPLRAHAFQGGWFWHEGEEDKIRPLENLKDRYLQTVGRNTNLLLGVVIDDRGLIPAADSVRMVDFGKLIKSAFSNPIGSTSGEGSEFVVHLSESKSLNYIVIEEEISLGERIRQYKVLGRIDNTWVELSEGQSIGHKRIIAIDTIQKFSDIKTINHQSRRGSHFKRPHYLLNMTMKKLSAFILTIVLLTLQVEGKDDRPNILWIMMEDWGYQLSCYGEPGIQTPNIDKVAEEGIRFTNSFCTSPVCSPSRSAMITGFHQNYIGCNQHNTENKQPLPYGIKPITHLLEEVGYFTCFMANRKTHLNFVTEKPIYQGDDWNERKGGQPFFAQLTFYKSHRVWQRDTLNPINICDVRLPPYYPQNELAKRDWANGLESAQVVDREIGEVLQRLEDEGLADNTIVFIIGDNGRCMPRGKQFLYDGGIQVPMIIRWPAKIKGGQVIEDMVYTLDISKTILDLADAKSSHPLHGLNLLDGSTKDRKFIFAARDKMDNTYDAMRTIRSREFKLIHNLMPERAYCQFNEYKEKRYPLLALMNVLNMRGELTSEQAAFMAPEKPEFELYDLINDPYEMYNLADDPKYAGVKEELLSELNSWRENVIKDQGVTDEFRQGGWSSEYPTRTQEQWQEALNLWYPFVFREPGIKVDHPVNKIAETDIIRRSGSK